MYVQDLYSLYSWYGVGALVLRNRLAPTVFAARGGLMTIVLLILGLVLLTGGADVLVRGASGLARRCGLSPLVVGLTVVAFGTSAPELAVSIKAAYAGQADLAIGNVVGSNVFNVLFILGISALIVPLVASRQLQRRDVPVMIAVSGLTWWLAADGAISRLDGFLLFAAGIVYTTVLVIGSRREMRREVAAQPPAVAAKPEAPVWRSSLEVVVGLALLVLGAHWLVGGAVTLARWFGVDEVVIGLTIVAAGTSLPEVATSIVASVRGERDIAIGNVIGSNIFNLLIVLGGSALVAQAGMRVNPTIFAFDIPVMVGVAVACLPIFFTGGCIARWEGVLFLTAYVAYVTYLIFTATQHAGLPTLTKVLQYGALPAAAAAILISVLIALRTRRSALG